MAYQYQAVSPEQWVYLRSPVAPANIGKSPKRCGSGDGDLMAYVVSREEAGAQSSVPYGIRLTELFPFN